MIFDLIAKNAKTRKTFLTRTIVGNTATYRETHVVKGPEVFRQRVVVFPVQVCNIPEILPLQFTGFGVSLDAKCWNNPIEVCLLTSRPTTYTKYNHTITTTIIYYILFSWYPCLQRNFIKGNQSDQCNFRVHNCIETSSTLIIVSCEDSPTASQTISDIDLTYAISMSYIRKFTYKIIDIS